jgi:Tfp pilus assembly protein PilN
MIRINILRNRGGTSSLKTSVTSMTGITFTNIGDGGGESGYADENSAMLKKILMALVFPILIIGYDQYAKSEKSSQLAVLQNEKTNLTTKLKSFGPKAESVKKFQQEKEKLEKRIDIIKSISKERLKVVKAMDSLHRNVPQQAWLTELTVKENYSVKILGFALDDFVVSNMIQNLDESIFFESVKLVSSQESSVTDGKLRKFEISGQLGDY